MADDKQAYLGVDLGGSNIYSCAFNAVGDVVAESKIDTEARGGYAHVLDRIRGEIVAVRKELVEKGYELKGVGLCVPGVVVADQGRVKIAPNLEWEDEQPAEDLRNGDLAGLPIVLANDVNAGLIGELSAHEHPPENVVAYFCGTGIGGAVVLNGKLITGRLGGAGEVGHMVVRLGGRKIQDGGIRGSLESYIGKWALNHKIRRRLDSGKKTALRKIIDYDLNKTPVKSSSLKKAYTAGDKFTVDLMEGYYCKYLGAGIAQTTNLLEPELIVLGGGIMEALGLSLIPHIMKYLDKYCVAHIPELRLAHMGDLAGPAGAARLAREAQEAGAER